VNSNQQGHTPSVPTETGGNRGRFGWKKGGSELPFYLYKLLIISLEVGRKQGAAFFLGSRVLAIVILPSKSVPKWFKVQSSRFKVASARDTRPRPETTKTEITR